MRLAACLVMACMTWSAPAGAQWAEPAGVTAMHAADGGDVIRVRPDSVPRLRTERIVWGAVIGALALATAGAMIEMGACESPTCERPIKGAVGGAVVGGALGALYGWLFALPPTTR